MSYHDVLSEEESEQLVSLEVQVFWQSCLFLGVFLQGRLGQSCGLGGLELALKVTRHLIRQTERRSLGLAFLGLAV